MRIGGGGSQDVNLLQSDSAQYRNQDLVTSQGLAFAGSTVQVAVAAEYAHVQLYNPAESGVVIIVDRVFVSFSAAMRANVARYETALTTLNVNWRNKLAGSADGAGEVRRQSDGSQLFDAGWYTQELAAGAIWTVPLDHPIILPEGQGIVVFGNTVNIGVTASFAGREV